jgi:hypothetical protein
MYQFVHTLHLLLKNYSKTQEQRHELSGAFFLCVPSGSLESLPYTIPFAFIVRLTF